MRILEMEWRNAIMEIQGDGVVVQSPPQNHTDVELNQFKFILTYPWSAFRTLMQLINHVYRGKRGWWWFKHILFWYIRWEYAKEDWVRLKVRHWCWNSIDIGKCPLVICLCIQHWYYVHWVSTDSQPIALYLRISHCVWSRYKALSNATHWNAGK